MYVTRPTQLGRANGKYYLVYVFGSYSRRTERLSVARTRIDSWQHSRSVTVSQLTDWPFSRYTFAFVKGFTCPAAASQQNVESRVVIPDFLTWLTLEIVDDVVYNPSSSEHFNRLKVRPQVINQILNTIRYFQVLESFARFEGTSFQSLQKFTSLSLLRHSCIGHKETNRPLVLSEIRSVVKRWNHFAPSVTILPWIIARGVNGRIPLWRILVRPRRMSFPVVPRP